MARTWDARAWAASIFQCSREELTPGPVEPVPSGGQQVTYYKDDVAIGQVVFAGPAAPLDSTASGHWVLVFVAADGHRTSHQREVPDDVKIVV